MLILKPIELNVKIFGKYYACHTIVNGISNMWSHLKVCKKFLFVIDKKQKVLVLEPKIERVNWENKMWEVLR